MTNGQVHKLLESEKLSQRCGHPAFIETHISWVLLCSDLVYKIKKPIQYSFLDFSTLEKRKYYCQREIELNRRLTENIYLDVLPVRETADRISLDGTDGTIIDYAVKMRAMDRQKQMDVLLKNNKVSPDDMRRLAQKIVSFHKNTQIIFQKDYLDLRQAFNDLEKEAGFLRKHLNASCSRIIEQALTFSDSFINHNKGVLESRLRAGFFRDCHGDLHSRNIFLLPSPQPFDCIEFNDDFRQIDVLNEVAFLCMDLDAFDRQDLSDLFFNAYNHLFPAMKTRQDHQLFIYYKTYRANIRAKVNSLRARSAEGKAQRRQCLQEAEKYLRLMEHYLNTMAPD